MIQYKIVAYHRCPLASDHPLATGTDNISETQQHNLIANISVTLSLGAWLVQLRICSTEGNTNDIDLVMTQPRFIDCFKQIISQATQSEPELLYLC